MLINGARSMASSILMSKLLTDEINYLDNFYILSVTINIFIYEVKIYISNSQVRDYKD